MFEIRVSDFKELHDALSRYRRDNRWMFRGQSHPAWPLTPKAGRPEFIEANDQTIFEAWKRRAPQFVDLHPNNDWEWLAIAQHHGLATRLLDWTNQPLVAAFFATWDKTSFNEDAHIYCFNAASVRTGFGSGPFSVDTVAKYKPTGVVARIINQGALFSVHPDPSVPLAASLDEDDELERVVIEGAYCKELPYELAHYGVHHFSVFPDLDGLSALVNWYNTAGTYWRTDPESEI